MSKESESVTLNAVLAYYEAAKTGYWNDLGGVCHYGLTDPNDSSPFDMKSAQYAMECKLGETLGLHSGAKVLDAGCGYSPVARTLARNFGFQVTGIDLIDERLIEGKKLNTKAQFDIDLAGADYHDLPFHDNYFDGIYTMETLVHAYSLEKVLKEFKRVLKPGGALVLFEYSIPELKTVPPIARHLAERVIKNTGMTSLPKFTHGSFPKILTEAGFDNVEANEISKYVHPSWRYLWFYAMGLALKDTLTKGFSLDRIPGSAFIYPAKDKLGYNICRAIKPYNI